VSIENGLETDPAYRAGGATIIPADVPEVASQRDPSSAAEREARERSFREFHVALAALKERYLASEERTAAPDAAFVEAIHTWLREQLAELPPSAVDEDGTSNPPEHDSS